MPNKRLLMLAVLGATLVSGAASAADKLTFQLGWLPGGEKAPAYVALQKGLFSAEGLDVSIVGGRGSNDVLTKLSTNVYEIGEVTFDALLMRKAEGPAPVMAIMPLYTKQPDALITTAGSGINTFKDIRGRTIGTSLFSSSNLALPVVLAANAISLDSFKLVKVDANALTPMLATGQIEAMINWLPSAALVAPMLAQSGKEVKVLPWSDYGFEGYSQSIIVSDKFLAEKPDAVRRFVKAMRNAVEMVAKDNDMAAAAVKASVHEADLATLKAQVAATAPLMVNEVTARDGLGVFQAGLVKKTWDWVSKATNKPADAIDPLATIAPDMRPR